MDPSIEVTTTDRILAIPRNDVIPGKSLHPKTRRADTAITDYFVELEARGTANSLRGILNNPADLGSAVCAARLQARYYSLATASLSPQGREMTVQQSLIDALGKDAPQAAREAITLDVTRALMETADPAKLSDFYSWYYQLGEYAPPKGQAPKKEGATQ